MTTPHELSYSDVIKGLDLFTELSIPILGIVENMSGFKPSCCDSTYQIFGQSKVENM